MHRIALPGWVLAGAAGLLIAVSMPQSSSAMGDPPAPAPDKCKQYKEGSADWKRCKAQTKHLEDDEAAYARGYALAIAGNYAPALDALRSVGNQADPRVQTMIGFSLRNLGMVDEAIAYYTAALGTNPNLTTTRQYLGEAFLQKGDRAGAEQQLAEIARRCGISCADYKALAAAIARGA
jgi:tetratricopeptide (TPR) repeat protein